MLGLEIGVGVLLGDLLCAVPALRALRRHLPETRITLIGLPWARDFSLRFGSYIDDFIEFPGWPGLPERTPEVQVIPWWLREMQERKFDLAIQLHGSGPTVNTVTTLLGAERSAGYFLPGDWCPDPASYLPLPEGDHEIQMHLRLMQFLGVPTESDDLEFPIGSRDVQDFNALLPSIPVSSPYVCIHPGARLASRPAAGRGTRDTVHGNGGGNGNGGIAGAVPSLPPAAGIMPGTGSPSGFHIFWKNSIASCGVNSLAIACDLSAVVPRCPNFRRPAHEREQRTNGFLFDIRYYAAP